MHSLTLFRALLVFGIEMASNSKQTTPESTVTEERCQEMSGDEVVITGMSGLFPKSDSVFEFMENLFNKVDMVSDKDLRWHVEHPEIPKHFGIINGINKFDAQFFKVHYKQALNLDPLCKKLLEQAYSAIFDAGVNPAELRGKKVGVFIGSSFSESEKILFYDVVYQDGFGITGCSKTMYANRISYWLDSKAPSYTLDLACASSMVCLDHAYRSIRSGESDAAIVGGCNLCMHPIINLNMKKAGFLCLDGKTKCFDKKGDGYVRSDTISTIFLQKAKDARRIYAEVYHTKASHSLLAKDRFLPTRPAKEIQEFLEDFYSELDVSANDVEYIEANGAGIAEADSNELEAIGEFFAKDRIVKVGSVKSNMGHSEPASGVTSLTKVCLAYHKGQLPANLHYENPHDQIPAVRDDRIQVVTENVPFKRGFTALNSFSYSGANIHILMKGHYKPKDANRYKTSIPYLVLTSGRQEMCVSSTLAKLKSQPIDPEQIGLLHTIYETEITEHTCRGYTILDNNENQETVSFGQGVEYISGHSAPIWFVYSGMGSQWPTMGSELMRIPIFAGAIQKCHQVLEAKGVNLIKILTDPDKTVFDNILHSFVGIAAVQIGLTDILNELGIVPDNIIGHSVGELGCAYADGCFTAEEMILSAYSRGLVSVQTPFIYGSMAAVGLGYKTIKDLCPPEIEIACHNSPESSTISGPANIMKSFVAELVSSGVFAKEVPCSNIAYHSSYIAKAGPMLLKYLKDVIKDPKPRSNKWVSTSVPQQKWNEPAAKFSSPEYHTNNLLNPVLFEETSRLIPDIALVIEIAPHGLLQAILKRAMPRCIHVPLTRRNNPNNVNYLLEAIGKLYLIGLKPKVNVLYPKIEFPVSTETSLLSHLVEWEHSETWPIARYIGKKRIMAACRDLILSIYDDDYKYLTGSIRDDMIICPEAAYLVMVWETLAMTKHMNYRDMSVIFNNIQFHSEVEIKAEEPLKLEIMIHKGNQYFEVSYKQSVVVTGYIRNVKSVFERKILIENTETYDDNDDVHLNVHDIYKIMKLRGYCYKDEFQSMHSINAKSKTANIYWNNKWIPFLDSLMQFNIFLRNHGAISTVKYINKLSIDVMKQGKHPIKANNLNFLQGQFYEIFDAIVCGGVNIHNLTLIDKPVIVTEPDVVQTRLFIPHFNGVITDLKEALHVNLQIVSDNVDDDVIKITEIFPTHYLNVSKIIKEVSDEIATKEFVINSIKGHNFTSTTETMDTSSLIITDRFLGDKNKMNTLYGRISSKEFVLAIERNLNEIYLKYELFNMITVMFVHKIILVLLRKNEVADKENITYIPIERTDHFSWVSKIPVLLKTNKKVILIAERHLDCGLLGMVHKLRKEFENKIGLIVDEENLVSNFDPENITIREQIKKNLAINIYKKGQWGDYYDIPSATKMTIKNVTLRSAVSSDSNTLTWTEAPPFSTKNNLVTVYYAGILNQDVRKAVGDISDNSNAFGMDFSGIDDNGNNVMGLMYGGTLSSTIEADPALLWPVPQYWSLEDAATVPLAYAHAYYCLGIAMKLVRRSQVFVNGGDESLGQAILSVCLSLDCTVYVSVKNMMKKKILLNMFPHLDENNVCYLDAGLADSIVITNTNNKRCDIVINCERGKFREAAMKCVGFSGYILDVSDYDMQDNQNFGMSFLFGMKNYKSVRLASIFKPEFKNEKKCLQILIADGIRKGIVRPLNRIVFAPTDVSKAFRSYTSDRLSGKILIRMKGIENVELQGTPRMTYSSKGTYVVVCNNNDFSIEIIDRLVKCGARKLVVYINSVRLSGYLNFKMMSWKKQNVTIQLSSEKLHTEETCINLLKEIAKSCPVSGIFIVQYYEANGKEDCFTPEYISQKNKSVISRIANMDLASKAVCRDLRYFVVINYHPNDAIDEYLVSATERICEARNEISLPALAFRVDSIKELDNSMKNSPKTRSQKITTVFNALESSLKLGYANVVTFDLKRPKEIKFLQKIAKIIGVKNIENISDSLTLYDFGINEIGVRKIKSVIEEFYHDNIPVEKVAQMNIVTLKNIGNVQKNQNIKLKAGLGVFYTYIDKDECLASEPMIHMATKLSKATEEEQEIDPKETYLFLIPGFEGHHHIFTRVSERLKVKALAFQLSPDIIDHSIQKMAADILTFTKKRFDLKQTFYILGYSFGVNIALELASLLEKEGYKGVVYCLDSSPDALKAQMDAYLGNSSDKMLQNMIIEHMYRLMTGQDSDKLKQEIENMDSWSKKIESCVYRLRSSVRYSNQYTRSLLESAYRRMLLAKEYEPDFKLKSKIVLLKGIPHHEQDCLGDDYNLSKYTYQPVEVFQIESDHASAPYDCRVSNIVNRFLDSELLEDFEKKSLCDTYITGSFQWS